MGIRHLGLASLVVHWTAMRTRLQVVNGDAQLEITESADVKRRLSEKALVRRKENLQISISRFEADLALVEADLALLSAAKYEKGTK